MAWRESTLTRVKELQSLCAWSKGHHCVKNEEVFSAAVEDHLRAAKDAAMAVRPTSPRPHLFRSSSLRERAFSNLDAAEAQLLNFAPPAYLLGQIPSLLAHVRCHLTKSDPRRVEFERIAQKLGVQDPDHPLVDDRRLSHENRVAEAGRERGQIVTATRAASSAALREQVQLRSFRNVLVVTAVLMSLLAVGIAVVGWLFPTLIPLCFAPQEDGVATVVCPTAQSLPFELKSPFDPNAPAAVPPPADIDDSIQQTASSKDLLVVELVGLTAAAVASATAIRGIRGSSERYGMPVALALLKLPTGAITAFLGLLLMRGQFVPGLSALDTSAQILAWALVFGYAQQLFTRLVDKQGQVVLDSVRAADKAQ